MRNLKEKLTYFAYDSADVIIGPLEARWYRSLDEYYDFIGQRFGRYYNLNPIHTKVRNQVLDGMNSISIMIFNNFGRQVG